MELAVPYYAVLIAAVLSFIVGGMCITTAFWECLDEVNEN